MRILAIDPGTHCGWATWDGQHVESGVQVFDLKRGESPGMRFLRFRRWLHQVVWSLDRDFIIIDPSTYQAPDLLFVYEQAHHRGGAATEILVGMTTRIQEFAAEIGAEHASVHSGTLKKFATGKGNASKADMIVAAEGWGARWGIGDTITDDNIADALLLLAWAREEFGKEGE